MEHPLRNTGNGATLDRVTATPIRAKSLRHRDLEEAGAGPCREGRHRDLDQKLVVAERRRGYSARDPYGTGMVSIIHPWESGMDNSPLWDDALSAVETGPSVAHLRKDTGFAAADERPTAPEYARYINLVIRFRDNGYRADRLYDISPFRVADIGFNAILHRANRDLRFLLAATGDVAGAAEVAIMEQKTEAAIAGCWHEEDGFFYSVDTRTSVMIRKPGIAATIPLRKPRE
jgi:hypothetical protein